MPYPPLDGGAQLINNSTKGLIECGVDLTLLAINTPKNPVSLEDIPDEYKRKTNLTVVEVDTRIKPLQAFFNLFQHQSYFISRFYSANFSSELKDILSSNKFDIIQLEHLYLCIYIDVIRKYSNAKIILRPQNIEYVIWELYLNNSKNIFKNLFNLSNIVTRIIKMNTYVSATDFKPALSQRYAYRSNKKTKQIT